VTGALSRLQMARAQKMIGNNAGARKWYEEFLTLCKDADPDIPIYQQAKAEYSKLIFPGKITERATSKKAHKDPECWGKESCVSLCIANTKVSPIPSSNCSASEVSGLIKACRSQVNGIKFERSKCLNQLTMIDVAFSAVLIREAGELNERTRIIFRCDLRGADATG